MYSFTEEAAEVGVRHQSTRRRERYCESCDPCDLPKHLVCALAEFRVLLARGICEPVFMKTYCF